MSHRTLLQLIHSNREQISAPQREQISLPHCRPQRIRRLRRSVKVVMRTLRGDSICPRPGTMIDSMNEMGVHDNNEHRERLGEIFAFLRERRNELELADPEISILWSAFGGRRPAAVITPATPDIPYEDHHLRRLQRRMRQEMERLGFCPVSLEIRCGLGLDMERLPALLVPEMQEPRAVAFGEEYSQFSVIVSDADSIRDVPCPTEGCDIRPLVVHRRDLLPTVFTMRIRELFAKFLTDNRHTRIDAVPVPPGTPADLPLGFLVFEQVPHPTSIRDPFAEIYRAPTYIRVM